MRWSQSVIKRAIELGNESHWTFRQASNLSCRLQKFDDAILFAKKAVDAKDNDEHTRANHKEHLTNTMRLAGKLK